MAEAANSTNSDYKSFKSSLNNGVLFLMLDSEHDRLLIEVELASSRFEIRRKIISTKEEVHQITGEQSISY